MRWNREKLTFVLAALLALAGSFLTVSAILSEPSLDVRLPGLAVSAVETKPYLPERREFRGSGETSRNPFRVADGWTRIEPQPISPPTLPRRLRIEPPLSSSVLALEGGLRFVERAAVELDPAAEEEGGS